MKRTLRIILPALFVAFAAGCGGDEPALKDEMSSADKAAYEKKNKRTEGLGADASPTSQQQNSDEYKRAMSGGGGPGGRQGKGR